MLIQLAEFLSQPLMLDQSYMARLHSMVRSGEASHIEPIRNEVRLAAENQAKSAKGQSSRITAVLPICGVIDQRDSWMLQMFGGTALDSLLEALSICMNEDRIGGVIFDFASPGGSSFGVKEVADCIASCRKEKPIVSVSNSIMASAAYYLGSAASRVYATPSSVSGSIGVYLEHEDHTKANEQDGITKTIIRVPEFKAEGHPDEPLTDAARSQMEARCVEIYDMFTSDVARYRGTDQATVKAEYGMGRTLSSANALACGMIDRVATFSEVCDQMRSGTIARSLAQSGKLEGCVDTAMLRNRLDAAML